MINNKAYDATLINLQDIIITNAAISNSTSLGELPKNAYKYDIKFQFTFGVNISLKRIRTNINIDIETLTPEGEAIEVSGTFNIAYIFKVDNLPMLVQAQDDDIIVSPQLLVPLANIAYSTSRGVVYTRCQGTVLKNVILPILPNSNIEEIISRNGQKQ